NWAAGLCTLNWMLLRRMWNVAMVYAAATGGLALLVFALGSPFLQWPQGVLWGVVAALAVPIFAVPGLYGNAMLHTETRRRIARALGDARTVPEAYALLARSGTTPRRLKLLGAAN